MSEQCEDKYKSEPRGNAYDSEAERPVGNQPQYAHLARNTTNAQRGRGEGPVGNWPEMPTLTWQLGGLQRCLHVNTGDDRSLAGTVL